MHVLDCQLNAFLFLNVFVDLVLLLCYFLCGLNAVLSHRSYPFDVVAHQTVKALYSSQDGKDFIKPGSDLVVQGNFDLI